MNSAAQPQLLTPATCFHCGDTVPPGSDFTLEIGGELRPMCCPGCRAVASLIADSGLEKFYERRTAFNERPENRDGVSRDGADEFAIYDDPGLAEQFCTLHKDGTRDLRLLVGGVSCAACTWLIETTLLRDPAIDAASLNLTQGRLDLRVTDPKLPLSSVFARIGALGYQVKPWHSSAQRDQAKSEYRTDLRRLAVAGIGMMQVGMFAIALHAGDMQGISAEYERLLRGFSLLVTGFVVAFSARGFFRSAWRHLRHGALVMDLPVSLAIGLAFTASAVATFKGGGDVYFDSVVMFTFLLLLARFIEKRLRYRDALVWQDAEQTLPDAVQVRRNGHWRSAPRHELEQGDEVLVPPGATLPIDGTVLRGSSAVREDSFSGEAVPRSVAAGAAVYAGTLNLEGSLELRATGTYADTRLAALQRSIESARLSKPAVAKLADGIASWFIAGVLVATSITALAWWQLAPDRALWVAISVLVISCPCALSLATPAALASSASLLRRQGILVHGEDALEALSRCSHAVFDKTGTLTNGAFAITELRRLSDAVTDEELRALGSALQQHTNHPIAAAFTRDGPRPPLSDVRYVVGAGLEGHWQGRTLRMGSQNYCRDIAPELPPMPEEPGYWIALCGEREPLAWFCLADTQRPEADKVLDALRQEGVGLSLLTGDGSSYSAEFGRQLGFAHIATGLSPEDKLSRVAELQARGQRVLMVGDGLNDAPVLKSADVSIAVAGATDLAKAQADFVLVNGDLHQIPYLRALAKATRRVILQNFSWALAYNAVGIPLAAAGLIPPWAAAIGMSLSSLLVVINASRLRRMRIQTGV